jgi:putative flippase GtrA
MTLVNSKARRELNRFYKFSIVGVIGAIVDFGTFNLLHSIVGINIAIASTISFCAAVTSNFIWNRYWTYPDSRSKSPRRQAIQFFVVNLIGWFIRTRVILFLLEPMTRLARIFINVWPSNLPPGSDSLLAIPAEVIGSNLALAIAVLIVMIWNFSINRIWTYSDVA